MGSTAPSSKWWLTISLGSGMSSLSWWWGSEYHLCDDDENVNIMMMMRIWMWSWRWRRGFDGYEEGDEINTKCQLTIFDVSDILLFGGILLFDDIFPFHLLFSLFDDFTDSHVQALPPCQAGYKPLLFPQNLPWMINIYFFEGASGFFCSIAHPIS